MRLRPGGFLRTYRLELLVIVVALVMALLSGIIFINFGEASGLAEITADTPATAGSTTSGPYFDQDTAHLGGYTPTVKNGTVDTAGGLDRPGADGNAAEAPAAAPNQTGPAQSSATAPAPTTGTGGSAGAISPAPPATGGDDATGIKVTLAIDSGADRLQCPVRMDEGSTVFDLLLQASGQCGFSFGYSNDSSYGAFVEELDGVSNDPGSGMFWLYYVNGSYASLGASSQTLSEGDVILWRYELTR